MIFFGSRETSTPRSLCGRALLIVCLGGCVDRSGVSDSDSDSDSAGATGSASGTTGSAGSSGDTATGDTTPTSGPSTTVDPGTTGSDTTGAGTTGEDNVCPPSELVFFHAALSTPDDFFEGMLDWDCKVLEMVDVADGLSIGLECSEGGMPVTPAPTLVLTAKPKPGPIALTVDDAVHIHVEQLAPWWTETSIRVEAIDETLLLAWTETSGELDPFAGVDLKNAPSICGTEETDCGVVQHDALEISIDGASAELQSRHFATIGEHGVWASDIHHYLEVNCTDFPDPWRDLAILRLAP